MTMQKFLVTVKSKLRCERWLCIRIAILSTIACSVTPSLLPAQNDYQLLFELPYEASLFTTDKLQHIYFVTDKNEVVKLKPDGTEQFRFINKILGSPSFLDATNPFNLLLFYPEYQNVVTLDRTLNLAGQYNLFDLGLFGVTSLGMAGDGNLWVYDAVTFRLKKIGYDGQVIVQSADLSLELKKNINSVRLLERGQQVYMNDPAIGILVFDVFGKYLKTLPIKGAEQVQVVGDQLIFFQEGKLFSFHLQTLLQTPLFLPGNLNTPQVFRIEKIGCMCTVIMFCGCISFKDL